MHEPVGQFPVRGQQQQSLSIDIQAADGDPTGPRQRRNRIEDRTPSLRIMTGRHLALRLVIQQYPPPNGGHAIQANGTPPGGHPVFRSQFLAQFRDFAGTAPQDGRRSAGALEVAP